MGACPTADSLKCGICLGLRINHDATSTDILHPRKRHPARAREFRDDLRQTLQSV
jgi:hypothetical protein